MKGLYKKAKAELGKIVDDNTPTTHPAAQHLRPSYLPGQQQHHFRGMTLDQPSTIQDPSAIDILRYRYHHGTNLGSIYVLERWLHPSMFPDDTSGSSELESVKGWVANIGLEATKEKFEEHWEHAVSDNDIDWLVKQAKCTTIRLPIGYFDLPSFTENTPFEPYVHVYLAAWPTIRTLISRLRAHNIGVLLDLHALPGGANCGDHSGTNSSTASLWKSAPNRDLGVRCCQFLANEIKSGLQVTGIQIVNEADWESDRMYDWYDECIDTVSAIDPSIPLIISDAWNLSRAVEYSLKKNVAYPSQPTCPVIIDTHYYWAFSDADKQKSPQEIIAEVNTKLTELDGKEGSVIDRGAVQAIVGEYSVTLAEDSWSKSGDTPKIDLVKQFGQAQSRRYQARTGGAFFWTWKMDWLPGGEWGFQAQSDAMSGSLVTPISSRVPASNIYTLLERANHRRDERMYDAVHHHVAYWDHLTPNTPCEHWRYENGWKVGYRDAYIFFEGRQTESVGKANKIGSVELWVLKRIRESGFQGDFVWEYEQGLRRGIFDFNAVAGI